MQTCARRLLLLSREGNLGVRQNVALKVQRAPELSMGCMARGWSSNRATLHASFLFRLVTDALPQQGQALQFTPQQQALTPVAGSKSKFAPRAEGLTPAIDARIVHLDQHLHPERAHDAT